MTCSADYLALLDLLKEPNDWQPDELADGEPLLTPYVVEVQALRVGVVPTVCAAEIQLERGERRKVEHLAVVPQAASRLRRAQLQPEAAIRRLAIAPHVETAALAAVRIASARLTGSTAGARAHGLDPSGRG